MTKRLLFTVNRPEFFLSHRVELALAARDAGYDVRVATPSNEHVPRILATGLPWHEIPLAPGGRNPFAEVRTLVALIRLYRRLRPAIVHQLTVKPVLYGTLAARIARVPAVVNAMPGLGYTFGADAGATAAIVRAGFGLLLRHPRMRFVFQNEEDQATFVRRGWSTPEQTVLIRGSGVDPGVFHPPTSPSPAPPLVVFAGRLLFPKGVREFVDAARLVRAHGFDARFAIIGDVDRHRPDSVTRADLERWREDVEIWGAHDDMPDVLRQAAIVCLPSYMPEGVPKVLIEAAATGVPIVTTDTPGCRDITADGENGLLVPPRDVPALATAIERLLRDPELRVRMGARGRERVLAQFTLQTVIDQTLALYRSLTD